MKAFKFILSLIIGLALSLPSFAVEIDGIEYYFYSNGQASVYSRSDNEKYSGNIVIPETVNYNGVDYKVVDIGNHAFYNCTELESVIIPLSVTSIGRRAFDGCINLKSVYIPDCVSTIGEWAFINCESLSSINLPTNLTKLDFSTFYGCKSLTSIYIHKNINSIASDVFLGCVNLTSINVDAENMRYSSVDGVLFDKEQKTIITFPAGIKGDYVIPESVTEIGQSAFFDCSGLMSVDIPENIITIGYEAFRGCTGLKSVDIPENTMTIGSLAFSGCSGLKSVTIPKNITKIERGTFSGCSGLVSLIIHNRVEGIGSYAFSGCTSLSSVSIPASVKNIFDGAFSGCTNLKAINVDTANTTYKSVDGVLFSKDMSYLLGYPAGIKGSYRIPTTVLIIAGGAFAGCVNLDAVEIPSNVGVIGESSFASCTALSEIVIPESVYYIGGSAFSDCVSLSSIYLKWENPSQISVKEDVFENYYDTDDDEIYDNATLYVPEGTIDEYREIEPWGNFKNINDKTSVSEIMPNLNAYYDGVSKIIYTGCSTGLSYVYDISGNIVMQGVYDHTINVSNLNDGIYVVMLPDGKKIKFKK